MRLFGSERIAKLMDRMGHKDGEVIEEGSIVKITMDGNHPFED